MPIEKNKRNHRSQKDHLERARAVQNVDYPNGSWRNRDGRPKGSKNKECKKKDLILEYAAVHPEASVTEISKALGISRPTIYKYLEKGAEKDMDKPIEVDYMVQMEDGTEFMIEKESSEK